MLSRHKLLIEQPDQVLPRIPGILSGNYRFVKVKSNNMYTDLVLGLKTPFYGEEFGIVRADHIDNELCVKGPFLLPHGDAFYHESLTPLTECDRSLVAFVNDVMDQCLNTEI